MMKAYIYSKQNGTVQIGGILFQPCTGAIIRAGRPSPKKAIAIVEVSGSTMAEAMKALQALI